MDDMNKRYGSLMNAQLKVANVYERNSEKNTTMNVLSEIIFAHNDINVSGKNIQPDSYVAEI